jgi:tyrosyl-tRNA synthetase
LSNVYEIFKERGFIEQITDPSEIEDVLGRRSITCYIGFDPTAASLHVGSVVPIMALAHMQRHGHRPIALVGGGTSLIGDPSGKTEMRKILSREEINSNAEGLRKQLSHYLDFSKGKSLLLNNADWLTPLNHIEFLRDIGRHFSVNRMLTAESYRQRMEKGLTFIEFNYMLLQSYDFLHLFKHHDCLMQMGGNDQWGNMVAGIDLIRRIEEKKAYCMTFPLITTSQGHKMGKTEKGTVWLDAALTSPYEYYQFWINTEDADVGRFLALFTFLPMEEVNAVKGLKDKDLNLAKSILAFEATKITHGEKAAVDAWRSSAGAFGARTMPQGLLPSSSIPRSVAETDTDALPSFQKERDELKRGVPAFELFHEAGLCSSRGEARRVISQGGGYVNDRQIKTFDEKISLADADDKGEIRLRKGKKRYAIVTASS